MSEKFQQLSKNIKQESFTKQKCAEGKKRQWKLVFWASIKKKKKKASTTSLITSLHNRDAADLFHATGTWRYFAEGREAFIISQYIKIFVLVAWCPAFLLCKQMAEFWKQQALKPY